MKLFKLARMQGGWYAGNFAPTAFHSHEFEAGLKQHKQGEEWPRHYHERATEINLLVRGFMIIHGDEKSTPITPGDIFVIEKREKAKPEFLSDCTIHVIKVPSIPGDKFLC